MKNLLFTSIFIALTSTGASAQYNTDCTRDYFGNFSCRTNPSDPGFIDFGAFQRGAQQANQERQQQQMMLQQIEMQQRMLEQQQQMRLQQEKLNEISEERNTPEWQQGGFFRRDEGKSADGRSRCVYLSNKGFVIIKGRRYQTFSALVAPEAQCPMSLSVSKTSGELR